VGGVGWGGGRREGGESRRCVDGEAAVPGGLAPPLLGSSSTTRHSQKALQKRREAGETFPSWSTKCRWGRASSLSGEPELEAPKAKRGGGSLGERERTYEKRTVSFSPEKTTRKQSPEVGSGREWPCGPTNRERGMGLRRKTERTTPVSKHMSDLSPGGRLKDDMKKKIRNERGGDPVRPANKVRTYRPPE